LPTPWEYSSKLDIPHLASLKMLRHDNAQTSLALSIWLNRIFGLNGNFSDNFSVSNGCVAATTHFKTIFSNLPFYDSERQVLHVYLLWIFSENVGNLSEIRLTLHQKSQQ
jgi:hypothetical protein